MKTKNWKRVIGIAAALVLGGVVAVACSHGGRGKMTPARMKTMVTWKVNDVLDDIDATSAQRKVVLDQTYKVLADLEKLHAQSEANHEKLIGELVSSQPRAEVIHAMVDERTDAFRAFMHRSVDALLVANAALSIDQREQLAAKVREHMQDR